MTEPATAAYEQGHKDACQDGDCVLRPSGLVARICGLSGNYGALMEPLACGYPKGHDGDHAWVSLPTFVNGQPVPDPDSAWWIVTADGLRVGGPFDDHEDAEGFAATWNSAYPSPEHTEFVVKQITAEEAIRLDRRNV